MRTERTLMWGALALALILAAGPARAGAPNASLSGPTRGGLNLVLPYYPATTRAAGLGTSTVALGGVDSHNPAALGFAEGFDVNMDYGNIDFDEGPRVGVAHGHVVFPVPGIGGHMKLMGYEMDTHDERMSRMGAETEVWGSEFGFAYGRQVPLPDNCPARLSLGLGGFPYDPSRLRLSAPGGGEIAEGKGQSQLGSIRAGALLEYDRFSLGAQYTHIKDKLWAKFKGLPRFEDNYYVNLFTLGAGYRPDEKTVILIQHLSGRAQGQGVRANYDIFSLGAERQIIDAVALRVGLLDGKVTCGVGVKLPYDFRLDYAYLNDYGQEVERAFDTGDMHMIGIGKKF